MEDHTDVASQPPEIWVLLLQVRFKDVRIVEGLKVVEMGFHQAEALFVDRLRKKG
jgi:hypothetical protein